MRIEPLTVVVFLLITGPGPALAAGDCTDLATSVLAEPPWYAEQCAPPWNVVVPVGGEFQINTYTTSSQRRPAVAYGADGDFVVVWQSDGSAGTDSSFRSIQGQRYGSDGAPAGGQFQVNSYTMLDQSFPAVAFAADGDFAVVWQSDGSAGTDSSFRSIQGQRYTSDGAPAGGEFQVNTYTTSSQRRPAVAAGADGDFVVVWESDVSGGTDSSGTSIQGQRYASDGTPVGGEFQVNSYTTDEQRRAAVAVAADGDFVVTWNSEASGGTDSSYRSIQGQRYASDGAPVGDQFQVNSYTTEQQAYPRVTAGAAGDFVVVWQSEGSADTDSSSYSIQGQRYASDGAPVGGQFQVNTYTTSYQFRPSVAAGADGDFVVVWYGGASGGTDSSYSSVHGRRYASDGAPVGNEIQVNTHTTGYQFYSAVAFAADGDFVVVWASFGSSGTDTSSLSVQGQRYRDSDIFADGFESGDTSAWSSATP